MPKAEDTQLNVQIPGDPAAAPDDSAPAPDDASAARIAELESQLAQQAAVISQLNAQAASLATVPNSAPAVVGERRLIGEDWSSKTTSDAAAAGVRQTVLCSDGYFVPGA